jgi:short-subunit dehydrogenase
VTVTAVCPGPVRTEFGEMGGFGGADERIPGPLWLSAEKVARDALAAVERGDRITVPGAHNRIAALWGQHLPRSILLPLVKQVWPVE